MCPCQRRPIGGGFSPTQEEPRPAEPAEEATETMREICCRFPFLPFYLFPFALEFFFISFLLSTFRFVVAVSEFKTIKQTKSLNQEKRGKRARFLFKYSDVWRQEFALMASWLSWRHDSMQINSTIMESRGNPTKYLPPSGLCNADAFDIGFGNLHPPFQVARHRQRQFCQSDQIFRHQSEIQNMNFDKKSERSTLQL